MNGRTALAAGFALDAVAGDPARLHPVAGFGAAAARLERSLWRPQRAAGIVHTATLVAGAFALVRLGCRRRLVPAVAIWATLGGRSLERAARRMADALRAGRIDEARMLAPSLVGRDPSALDGPELCRAVVESVAENTNDAVVAPLFWAAVAGAPGAVAYRAVNTLDAMVGHRNERYADFGWCAARLDDAASWIPARITSVLAAALAPLVGGRRVDAWRTAWSDGRLHPSPNAGRVEGAFAGALGVRLGGINRYGSRIERRPFLGSGRAPEVADIERAVRLAGLVAVAALVLAVAGARR